MFQAVKTKINNLLSPTIEPPRNSQRSSRKRSFSCDIDSLQTPPAKRNKSGYTNPGSKWWKLTDLYNYVVGGNIFNKQSRNPSAQDEHFQLRHDRRTALSATRRMNISRRAPLSQISNATILDLTDVYDESDVPEKCNLRTSTRKPLSQISKAEVLDLTIDNDGENEEDELYLTKVSADLTKNNQHEQKHSHRCISRHKSAGLLHDNIRLDERKRYQELLAQFTTETLPEYSESISPRRAQIHNGNRIIKTSLFSERKERTFRIDLTKRNDHSPPRRMFFHEILNDSTSPSFLDYSLSKSGGKSLNRTTSPQSSSTLNQVSFQRYHSVDKDLTETESTVSTKSSNHSILLGSDWIKKWKDTLDPAQLERERQIRLSERKRDEIKAHQKAEFERLQKELGKSKDFPKLTDEMLSKVKQVLGAGRPNEVFAQGFNAEITRQDLSSLRDATWLNDEVVNFYFNMLKERSEKENSLPKVHVFNTFFYPKITKTGHSGVKRWTRKVDIFAHDMILIPIHLGMHWCLAVIDFKNKQIVYYDSLKGNNTQCLEYLKKYIQDESLDKKKTSFDLSDWSELMPKDIPEQLNGCDCGVFMCKYAEYQSRNAPFTFTQKNMPYFRKRMIYEIISKQLM